ncbi:ABC transporter substrate-binding protein [Mucilaginibacter corticis]|uniref:ABC transporter substrate-binding protein n=1 Tax=Mucilaginibacter corticis TaxID=2597670 RepID=A0A556MVT8_9SPHI|nr:ABC transporter substrate-binding protein [Mucilaginibacter corticis]TSJ44041.1 ABC transporter substrate-binding protein [Mucilaginibacter corticis]
MTALTEEQQERIDLIRHKLKFVEQRPTVACITALDPLILSGVKVDELANIAGGAAIAGDEQTLLELNPDVIILMPVDYSIAESMGHIDELLQIFGFVDLKAIKSNRLYIADASRFFEDSPEKWVESVELLAEIINPKQFIFGYEGDGWIRFTV